MIISRRFAVWLCFSISLIGTGAYSSSQKKAPLANRPITNSSQRDREIASQFAPVFYQALGDKPRSDYITNFDYDGDWQGDNNWSHLETRSFPLKAYIYYSVAETASHIFIHYAVFHPRDYKGGEVKGAILSELIREGAKRGRKFDPTGLADEATLAHENDLEGCLVVVEKGNVSLENARVVFVETLHHNHFSRYVAGEPAKADSERVRLNQQHPELYIEPKGHGIEAFLGTEKQAGDKSFLAYKFSGDASYPGDDTTSVECRNPPCSSFVGYALLPLETTLWLKAQHAPNATYAERCDYQTIAITVLQGKSRPLVKNVNIGKIGCAFVGRVGGQNMARPPWAWFDKDERERKLGGWFFDPATTVKRDFNLGDDFSTIYLHLPFWARK
ncbi:MAG TPA: hypothetical protein VIV66_15665 [Pyrinomonadaceae bacterium]